MSELRAGLSRTAKVIPASGITSDSERRAPPGGRALGSGGERSCAGRDQAGDLGDERFTGFYPSNRARRSAISVISCFMTRSEKKHAIQLTNAIHKSFGEKSSPDIAASQEVASA